MKRWLKLFGPSSISETLKELLKLLSGRVTSNGKAKKMISLMI